MNVWIIHQFAVPPFLPGVTRHFSLARELVRRGHTVTIVTADRHHRRQEPEPLPDGQDWKITPVEDVDFLWLRAKTAKASPIARVLNMFVFAIRTLRNQKLRTLPPPDVIMGCSPDPVTAYSAHLLSRRYNVPFVAHIGDIWPLVLVDLAGVSKWHPFILFLGVLEKQIYRRAALVVCPLPGAGRRLEECGVDPGRFLWLPNGAEPGAIPPPPREQGRPFTFMYAGMHGPSNALHTMIDAIAVFQKKYPEMDCRFRLVGDGSVKPWLKNKAFAAGIKNTSFEDPVPKTEVPALLAQADCFMLTAPQKDSYAYGISFNKLFEYMGAARPVVIAVSSCNNPVAEENCGLSVAAEDVEGFADALAKMTALPPEEREAMGRRGHEAVKRAYNFKKLGGTLESALLGLLSTDEKSLKKAA